MDQQPVEITLKAAPAPPKSVLPGSKPGWKATFIVGAIVLAAIFAIGLRWVFGVDPEGAPFMLFSYAVGLTMIFLPCTLPLAFVIVPLAMGKSYSKGFGIALAFGLGVTITLSIYGGILGFIGSTIAGGLSGQGMGSDSAEYLARFEGVKNILYALAGAFALLIALGEIGLIKWRLPTYSGAIPGSIQKKSDFIKAFLLGLFLGNIGVGCPNPLFNGVIIPNILINANVAGGFWTMFVHALGRVTPLLLLAFLAVLGVNATSFLVRHKDRIEKSTGWATVIVAGFIISLGLFGHDWYEYSGIHSLLERVTQEEAVTTLLGRGIGQLGHTHSVPLQGEYLRWGSWLMVLIWLIPILWWYRHEKNKARELEESDSQNRLKALGYARAFILAFIAFSLVTFIYILPHNFNFHWSSVEPEEEFEAYISLMVPDGLQSGIESPLIFNIKEKDKKAPLPLEVSHERLVHVVIISEDFKYFTHIHPEEFGSLDKQKEKGEYEVRYAFPQGGRYIVALDSFHEDHDLARQFLIDVSPVPKEVSLLKDFSRKKNFGEYAVSLSGPQVIKSGEEIELKYSFSKDAKVVDDLSPYLGAPMHFAIVSADMSSFAHTHGELHSASAQSGRRQVASLVHGGGMDLDALTKPSEEHDESSLPEQFGPEVYVHYVFPYPGLYQVFGEAFHDGKVVVTSFMVEVSPGRGSMLIDTEHGH